MNTEKVKSEDSKLPILDVMCRCKQCKNTYDKKDVKRVYGKESSVYLMNFCSARCYTDYLNDNE